MDEHIQVWSNVYGEGVFDWQTVIHLSLWVVVGALVAITKGRRDRAFIICLLMAIGWKVFSGFAHSLIPTVEQTDEIPMNMLMDISMCPLGLLFIWVLFDGRLKKS